MNTTLLLALIAFGTGAEPTAAGPLQSARPIVDLGDLKSGPLVPHDFELKHTGASGTLVIHEVTGGCGCMKAEIKPKVLKPGDTAKLCVIINTLTQREGANTWPLNVRYSTVANSQNTEFNLDLKLTAKLTSEVRVTPPLLAVSTSGAVKQTLRVDDSRAKPLNVTKVSTTNPAITATIETVQRANGVTGQEVSVNISETLPIGAYEETITLFTNDPACATMVVPVKVQKRGLDDPIATPAAATIRFSSGQADASTLVQIRHGGKPVSVAKVECATTGVTPKHSEGAGTVATVRIMVNGAKAGETGHAEVTVTLAEPAGKTILIPLTWYGP
jgi:hypothetical protein